MKFKKWNFLVLQEFQDSVKLVLSDMDNFMDIIVS